MNLTKSFLLALVLMLTENIFVDGAVWRSPNDDDQNYWRKYSENQIKKILKSQKVKSVDVAKNVIIFGDFTNLWTT